MKEMGVRGKLRNETMKVNKAMNSNSEKIFCDDLGFGTSKRSSRNVGKKKISHFEIIRRSYIQRVEIMRKMLIYFIIVLFMAVFAGCQSGSYADKGLLEASRRAGRNNIVWEKVKSFTFSSPSELSQYIQPTGKWEIKDGKLWAVAGKDSRAILLQKCFKGPVKMEFEATNYASEEGTIGDISVLINSLPGRREKKWFRQNNKDGYLLTTGSYANNCTAFYRKVVPFARTEYSPVISGKCNKIVLEYVNGHFRYWMNGEIILEAWDEKPLPMKPLLWLGLRTYNTLMAVDNVTIYRQKK
jgi:hypothetical protein